MKKQRLIILSSILLTFFIINSCKRSEPELPPADACFSTTKTTYTIFEDVKIINCSQNAQSYSWDFGDGHSSNEAVPTYQFEKPGNYTITLTAIGTSNTSNFSKTITITKIPPKSCFSTAYNTYEVDETVNFTNCSQDAETYSWNFGDGSTSTEMSPSHKYSSTGNYSVSLTATGNGLTDTKTTTINVVMTPPTASFTTQYTTYDVGEYINFTNQSQNAVSYYWEFGNGATSTLKNPTHSYSAEGSYNVKLTATADNGLTDRYTKTLNVVLTPPTASFTTQYTTYGVNEQISLVNNSQNSISYYWEFGDGNTSTLSNPIHSFSAEGSYNIKLTATAENGLTDTYSKIIDVVYEPVACFTTEYTDYFIDETVNFTNCSTDATEYLWNFGDGTTSTLQNPEHSYAAEGTYTVTLKAVSNGIEDVVTKTLGVHYTTDLDILVLINGTDTPVIDAEVTLYETEDDWVNDTNPFLSGNTDDQGIIVFENLDPVDYWVYAYKESTTPPDYFGNDNLGNIVGPLEEYGYNEYTVYVEFIYGKKGKKNSYIIKRIERNKTSRRNRSSNIVKNKKRIKR